MESKQSSPLFRPCICLFTSLALVGLLGGCGPGGVPSERSLNLKNAPNARDSGGYPARGGTVAWGLLYRSGKLSSITQAECESLRTAGIKTIIDLRNDQERVDAPDAACLFDFVRYESVPIQGAGSTRQEGYGLFISDPRFAAQFRAIFGILAERENLPVLIHCSAGKDRVGGIVALVHLLLGVEPDDIVTDYLLSTRAGRDVKAQWLQAALDQVQAEGGIEALLSKRGVGPETQQAVRANLLHQSLDGQ